MLGAYLFFEDYDVGIKFDESFELHPPPPNCERRVSFYEKSDTTTHGIMPDSEVNIN